MKEDGFVSIVVDLCGCDRGGNNKYAGSDGNIYRFMLLFEYTSAKPPIMY